jgi:hypothetical protein
MTFHLYDVLCYAGGRRYEMAAIVLGAIAFVVALSTLAVLLKGAKYLVAGKRMRDPTPMQRFMAERKRLRAH